MPVPPVRADGPIGTHSAKAGFVAPFLQRPARAHPRLRRTFMLRTDRDDHLSTSRSMDFSRHGRDFVLGRLDGLTRIQDPERTGAGFGGALCPLCARLGTLGHDALEHRLCIADAGGHDLRVLATADGRRRPQVAGGSVPLDGSLECSPLCNSAARFRRHPLCGRAARLGDGSAIGSAAAHSAGPGGGGGVDRHVRAGFRGAGLGVRRSRSGLSCPGRDRSEPDAPRIDYSPVFNAVHWPLIQVPTRPMVATTATNMMPSRTVYSINAAPSSSFLNCSKTVKALRMTTSPDYTLANPPALRAHAPRTPYAGSVRWIPLQGRGARSDRAPRAARLLERPVEGGPLAADPGADEADGRDDGDQHEAEQNGVLDQRGAILIVPELVKNGQSFTHDDTSRPKTRRFERSFAPLDCCMRRQ